MTLRASRRTEFIRRTRALVRIHTVRPAAPRPGPEGSVIHTPLQIGKYLVSPLTRTIDGGRFAASVSIRSGIGSMTHDRVLRFVPVFDTHDQATRFATEQALAWIARPLRAIPPSTTYQE